MEKLTRGENQYSEINQIGASEFGSLVYEGPEDRKSGEASATVPTQRSIVKKIKKKASNSINLNNS